MVSFFSLGFVIALVTAGATRMDRSEEVQDESTGTSECSDWGRLGHWGKCCTSKCNGQEDRIFKGHFKNCEVKMGKMFDVTKSGSYKCEEICTIRAERQFKMPFGSKYRESKVTVRRIGGFPELKRCETKKLHGWFD
ncbi:unnamed protein product [Durusdinium trenchii]|uniref:Secreted protein n=1 Tax=Durusdinium trenchii TaxID=1381693 RepID=A0ABP0KZ88_9DINO